LVKTARPTRREQAEQTRRRIIKAAYQLFCDAGYEDTTMQHVAGSAGVAVQTVYFVFGTKAKLLAEVESFVILGDAPSDRWREQPWASPAFLQATSEYWSALGLAPEPRILEAVGVAWWASLIAGNLARLPLVRHDERWLKCNVDAVLG